MKPKLLIGIVLVLASILFGVTAFKRSLTAYTTFSEARKSRATVQVNGVLADVSGVRYDAAASELVFKLKDEKNEVLDVVYKGVKPANFEQATNVVAIGSYHDGRFEADQLLVKCPSKYQAEGAAGSTAGTPPPGGTAPASTGY
ncbi:MAG: cytochrome c maturation protein CcmE [Candidatus Eiseniibacteriota bacterium]